MNREDDFCHNHFLERNVSGLALLCANVAKKCSADRKQSDAAHALWVEWVQLHSERTAQDNIEAEDESLKKRMAEFLAGVPPLMMRDG